MNRRPQDERSETNEGRPYASCSAFWLTEFISTDRSVPAVREAVWELCEHRTALPWNGTNLNLRGLLSAVCDTRWAKRMADHDPTVLEEASALTLDKFTQVPSGADQEPPLKSQGPDCRKYYRAYQSKMEELREEQPQLDPLELEAADGAILSAAVRRAFRFSCLEARRGCNPGRSRYGWKVRGGTIHLWMPRWMNGRQRREWLERNVPGPGVPGTAEKRRIQAIIDERLGHCRCVPLDRIACGRDGSWAGPGPAESLLEREIGVRGLATVVADEKVGIIHRQRPAVRQLGPRSLRALIRRIFQELSEECYEEKAVAAAFGLSRPTLSRFAGSHWSPTSKGRIPDLWRNLARLLAGGSPTFVEVALEAGVLPAVLDWLSRGQESEEGDPGDGS